MKGNTPSGGEIVLVMGIIYFGGATLISLALWRFFKIRPQDMESGWLKLIQLPLLPAFFLWMLIFAILSVPFYWLYPEKHLNEIDFEGSEEEKQKLRDYRLAIGKKGMIRRLAEKLTLAQKDDPPWPFTPES